MATRTPKAPSRKVFPRPTDRLTLNRKLQVSPLCVGMVGEPATVSHAFDRGINFFFLTADMHWPSYEALRVGLADLLARRPSVRDRIVVAVVTYMTQPEFCFLPFREVLDAVPALGHIDVTVAGGSYRGDFAARAEQFALHGPLGARAFGVSFHDRKMAAKALREKLVDIGFVRYNTEHLGAEKDLFPHVPRRGARPLVYNFTTTSGFVTPERCKALGLSDDHWQPEITDHYRFVLDRPEIDGLLCAPRTPAEVDGLVRALEAGGLTEEEKEYMRGMAELSLGRARMG